MAITTSRLMPFTLLARSSSFERPSGLITDLSKSNSTSAAKVTFSATGLGLASGLASGFGGGGAGLGSGFGGTGVGTGSGLGAGLGSSVVAQAAAKATATSTRNRFLVMFSLLSFFNFGESRVCVTLEGILPQLPALLQTGKGGRLQAAVDDARLSVHPDVRDVLSSGGIDEMRHGVVAGRELGGAQRHGGEIGRLARLDRARELVDAERLRARERSGAQGRMCGQRLRVACHRLREQRRGPHLLQEIEPIVARRAVGTEAYVGARLAQRFHRRKAARELEVRRGAVRDRGCVSAKELDFARLEMHRVHRDEPRTEQAEAPQPLDRPHTVLGKRAADLFLGLVQVHVHRQVELGRELRDLAEARVGLSIGGHGREAERHKRVVALKVET